PPEGEATPAEADSLSVRVAAAIMLAENGSVVLAEQLLEEPDIPIQSANHLRGLIALASDDRASATTYFSLALDSTEDWEEKGRFAYRLAILGYRHPFLQQQRELGNAQFADELEMFADAFGDEPGGIERLRAAAQVSARLTLILSQWYEAHGESENQLASLTAAAHRLDDADLWLSVAQRRIALGDAAIAIDSVHRAQASAPGGWGAAWQANRILVEAFSSLNDWDGATRAAENMVRLRPGEMDSTWALIACQFYSGELDTALETWTTTGGSQRPRHRQGVKVWLGLYQEYGSAVGTVEDLAELAAAWPEDEDIRRFIVTLVLFSPAPDMPDSPLPQLTEADNAQPVDTVREDEFVSEQSTVDPLRADLFSSYFADFPDGAIKQFTFDEDNPLGILEAIAEVVGERVDTSELDDGILSAQIPLGAFALAHGHSYAEAVVAGVSGVRFSTSNADGEKSNAEEAIGTSIVADTTALFTMTILPDEIVPKLLGSFSGVSVSADQFRDAVSAQRSFATLGGPGPLKSASSGPVARRYRSNQSREVSTVRAVDLVDRMRPMHREPRPANSLFQELQNGAGNDAWLSAAALAESTRFLWSDDLALNRLIDSLGGHAFSTPMLINVLLGLGKLSRVEADVARARLVSERFVEIPFDQGVYVAAVSMHAESPTNVASVIENLGGADGNQVMRFVLEQSGSLSSDGPELEKWFSASTRWLVRVSPDPKALSENLALLVAAILRSPWFDARTFSFVDAAIVDGLQTADGNPDPLLDAIESVFAELVQTRGRQLASQWVLDLISGLGPESRVRYTSFVIRV
ncbi:MAG: hypothetical protein JWO58_3377, partial [Chitinophagaceae bacterium]|nr:hypothetical protein [Chitinophagaceae bacterium]